MRQRQEPTTLQALYPDRWIPLNSLEGVREWKPEWFIPDLLYQNGTNYLFGPGKLGKSYLRTYLVVAALVGVDIFGLIKPAKKPANTLILIGERNRYFEAKRVYNIGNACGISDNEAKQLPITILDKSGLKIDTRWGQTALVKTVETDAFDLVIIDPLRAFHDRKENDSGDMAIVNNFLREFCDITTSWIIHHEGKPSETGGSFFTRGRQRTTGERMRGTTDMTAAADNIVGMERVAEQIRKLAFDRNVAEPNPPLRIVLENGVYKWTQSTEKEAVAYERIRDPEVSANEIARRQHFNRKKIQEAVKTFEKEQLDSEM